MLICVDIGNTHIVLGFYQKDQLLKSFRLKTDANTTEDEYGVKLLDILDFLNVSSQDIDAAIISSVVPALDSLIERAMIQYLKTTPVFVGPGLKTGIAIKIDDPRQLGADLLVGAVAAIHKYGAPVIIVDMGTATTLSVVNDKNEFLGGIILPGVLSSFESLVKSTSKLESVRFEEPKNFIGKNTMNSLQSGMIYGQSAMIDGLIRKIKQEVGPAQVVLTGGISRRIVSFLEEKVIYDSDLILEGLYLLYKMNKK